LLAFDPKVLTVCALSRSLSLDPLSPSQSLSLLCVFTTSINYSKS
jgi:hypothetical protein